MEITSGDIAAFREWSHTDFQRAVDTIAAAAHRVATGRMTKTAFGELESAIGFRCNPLGLVAHRDACNIAQPIQTMRYDWVHSMLQGGVLTSEVDALLELSGTRREDLQKFLADASWSFPRNNLEKSRQLHRIFNARRSAEDGKTKASCSELLGVYGLLRFFFELKLRDRPDMASGLRSFTSVCGVIDLLLTTKRRTASLPVLVGELKTAMATHLRLHIAAYGAQYVKPKHHWLLDVPDQVLRDGLLLDAFIIERMHLRVKSLAEKIKKTTSFEASVLSSALTVHLADVEAFDKGGGLRGRTAPFPGAHVGALVADKMECIGVTLAVGDFVTYGEDVGIIVACALEGGELYAIVRDLAKQSDLTTCVAKYTMTDSLSVWLASACAPAVAWRPRPDGCHVVVRR